MLPPHRHVASIAQQARELFVVHLGRVLPDLVGLCGTRLTAALEEAGTSRDMQSRADAWTAFQNGHTGWLHQSRKALQRSLLPRPASSGHSGLSPRGRLELLDDGAMDNQIMASRLAMRVLDVASSEFNELRLRMQYLEKRTELPSDDVLLPDVTARILVDQWLQAPMPREAWSLVQDALAPALARHMLDAYKASNEFLVSSGVMPEIDLQAWVKRRPDTPIGRASDFKPGRADPSASGAPFGSSGPAVSQGGAAGDSADKRLLARTAPPQTPARLRAQGLVGQLKRMFMAQAGTDLGVEPTAPTSAALQQAIQRVAVEKSAAPAHEGTVAQGVTELDHSHVAQAASALRVHTAELKQAARTPTEKATVEVVALMFQSILAEERIPPSVRVWFARLQIPVLRVALAEPEFFSTLKHPARRLIDRMGSCVMGFESHVSSVTLEAEIRRVVQVIEQYPDSGRRVFQLVLDEFQKFLSGYLSEKGGAGRLVTVAQQVEQKETLSVQYTIELRRLLNDMPVRTEVREFLFKVWVDVLALAGVKYGLKHEETSLLKQVAYDLLWAASAKTNRNDRAQVIQQLPGLLQRLRRGMGLLGYPPSLQDQYLTSVSEALSDAFLSLTEAMPQESLDHLSQRLAHLDDYLSDSGVGDLDLDSDSIEMITGVDASNIEVINQGGDEPDAAARAGLAELQTGSWFRLDHNGKLSHLQFAWRSDRGQLYLFVSNAGRCFLMQANRVAAYLQAGLLLPTEEEALTVRATRDALAKLDANPERLLA